MTCFLLGCSYTVKDEIGGEYVKDSNEQQHCEETLVVEKGKVLPTVLENQTSGSETNFPPVIQ